MTPSSDIAQPGNAMPEPVPEPVPEDLLSRDEIDALFDGLGGANPSRGAGYAADPAHTNAFGGAPEPAGEPMPFDWQNLPRISRANRGTMPALEVVNQRLLRNLQAALPALLGQHPDVTLQGTPGAALQRFSGRDTASFGLRGGQFAAIGGARPVGG